MINKHTQIRTSDGQVLVGYRVKKGQTKCLAIMKGNRCVGLKPVDELFKEIMNGPYIYLDDDDNILTT